MTRDCFGDPIDPRRPEWLIEDERLGALTGQSAVILWKRQIRRRAAKDTFLAAAFPRFVSFRLTWKLRHRHVGCNSQRAGARPSRGPSGSSEPILVSRVRNVSSAPISLPAHASAKPASRLRVAPVTPRLLPQDAGLTNDATRITPPYGYMTKR